MARRPLPRRRSSRNSDPPIASAGGLIPDDTAPGSPARRLGAHLIDLLFVAALAVPTAIVVALSAMLFMALNNLEGLGGKVGSIAEWTVYVLVVINFLVYNLLETTVSRATPGKFYLGLAVHGQDGRPPSLAQSLFRNVVKLLLNLFPFAFLTCFFDKKHRAPQDFLGITVSRHSEASKQDMPESVSMKLRFVAHLVDLYLLAIFSFTVLLLCTILVPIFSDRQSLTTAFMGVMWVLAVFVYFVGFETFGSGTPGKQCLGLALEGPTRGRITLSQVLARFALKLAMHACPFLLLTPLLHQPRRLPQDVPGLRVTQLPEDELEYTDDDVSPWMRLGAHVIDLILMPIILLIVACVTQIFCMFNSLPTKWIVSVMLFLGIPLYFIFFEALGLGTPGKTIMGLTVKSRTGEVNLPQAISRFMLKLAMHVCPPLLFLYLLHPARRLPQDVDGISVVKVAKDEIQRQNRKVSIAIGVCSVLYFGAFAVFGRPLPVRTLAQERAESEPEFKEKKQFPTSFDAKFKPNNAEVIHYQSKDKLLAWVVKPQSKPGAQAKSKYPAIMYAHGGEELSPDDLKNVEPFVKAGFIVMLPSWRGENGNPGYYECCYGEVDDAAAAVDYLSKREDVDESIICAAGHSIGGTIVLLLAESTSKLKKAASCGALTSMAIPPSSSGALPGRYAWIQMVANEMEREKYKTLIGPYPDFPCKLTSSAISLRSAGWNLSDLSCPLLLLYGDSNEQENRMSVLAKDMVSNREEKNNYNREMQKYDKNNHQKEIPPIRVESVPGDHFTALSYAIDRMLLFFSSN